MHKSRAQSLERKASRKNTPILNHLGQNFQKTSGITVVGVEDKIQALGRFPLPAY